MSRLSFLLLATASALTFSGCQRFVESHCANNGGDSDCRQRDAGMFCSSCTLDNDGCVAELPQDDSCHVSVAGSESGSESTATTDGPNPVTDDGNTTIVDSSSGSGSDSDSGSTTTGPIPVCADVGNTCIEPAPSGFDGPVARLSQDNTGAPSCPAPYDIVETETFSDLVAPAADCGCECGSLGGAACGSGEIRRYTSSICSGTALDTLAISGDGCTAAPGSWSTSQYYRYTFAEVTGGGCPEIPTETIEPAVFASRHLACGAALTEDGCTGGRLCAPEPQDPFPSIWCVWSEGEQECPAGSMYSAQTIVYRSFTDGRACSDCECTVPADAECVGAGITLTTAAGCGGLSAGSLTNGSCLDAVGTAVESISHSAPHVPASLECDANTPVPTGQALADQAVTFCCSG